jgi:hypothetical protein
MIIGRCSSTYIRSFLRLDLLDPPHPPPAKGGSIGSLRTNEQSGLLRFRRHP